jgi:hypothetical protein
VSVKYRVPGCVSHLFGNPAILIFWTRGFASPDYSGFALSENVSSLHQIDEHATILNKKNRAIVDDSTDSAGFTCLAGMKLTAFSILLQKYIHFKQKSRNYFPARLPLHDGGAARRGDN